MTNKNIIILILVVLAGCKSKNYNELEKITYTDGNKSFSIVIPKSWEIYEEDDGDYSLLELKSNGEYDIQLIVTSRKLDEKERRLELLDLIDRMLNTPIADLKSKDCKIINVGKAKEFKKGNPTFVITASTKSGKRIITQWGTVVDDKNYSFNMMTVNKEGSDELSEITRKLMESIKLPN
ncbi:hypothetical protein ES705_30391 [subsurface metagenome]